MLCGALSIGRLMVGMEKEDGTTCGAMALCCGGAVCMPGTD